MSAGKDDQGRYQIDPAELYRVFPVNTGNSQISVEGVRQETGLETGGLQATVEHLRELLAEIKDERDDLRRRLDREAEERREAQTKLTALLTHQPAPKADLPPTLPEPPRTIPAAFLGASVRFWVSLALVATSAAAWLWWKQQL
jgi:hypothetical protein